VTAGRTLGGLAALLRERGLLEGARGELGRQRVGGIVHDSRRVRPGNVFAALRGRREDGATYAPEAVARGAIAIMAAAPVEAVGVPQLVVSDDRAALALAAAWWHGWPSHDLGIVGVTGTDGKTTTAYLIRQALLAAGRSTGLVGTIDVICAGLSLGNEARATTPEAPELQGYLARMRDGGDRWAVIESTSHGLAQQRVGEVAYDVAVLTNMGLEHLEFHGTPEAYQAAKRTLFERLAVGPANPEKGHGKHAVINADDAHAPLFTSAARAAGARIVTYSTGWLPRADAGGSGGPGAAAADRPGVGHPPDLHLVADRVVEDGAGLSMRVHGPGWTLPVRLGLAGRFNVHNALAALGAAAALGLDPATAATALGALPAVPGRMQRVDLGQPFAVIVDYAHTAEALAKVLDELSPLARAAGAGLIAVFGSAGERDTQKRPSMGRVAGERCRLVVLTDEDPRGEDREAILEDIARGVRSAIATRVGRRGGPAAELRLIPDRREAIAAAVGAARPGDVVLLAGKGHERTIEVAGGALPWDEAAAAREALLALGYGVAVTGAGGEVTGAGGEVTGAGKRGARR
jgi:UDP-N-acetylmuramoyl-L-alanyl-D-glutamate--2,6-diaminopimelate ligase